MERTNVIIGQSGGPTAAINATLSGVIRGALNIGAKKIYGMINGIEGVLNGNIKDLTGLCTEENLKLLENTPAAALGSCRLKLPDITDEGTYKKIFAVFKEKNIKSVFYIGGNDSMDSVKKLSAYAAAIGSGIKIIGVPKTIDNDLSGTDHSPGYGSAAKYIAATMQEICHDNSIYNIKSIVITEIMGRDAGWLTAAASLPRQIGGKSPDLVYLPEIVFSDEKFLADIESVLEERKNIVAAVSEGVKYAGGRYVCDFDDRETDVFGHMNLSGTANRLKNLAKERFGCKVRAIELNTPQRCASHIASLRDLKESVKIGREAVFAAAEGKTGVMMTFIRKKLQPYKIKIGCENINNITNTIKTVPPQFINKARNGVTDECLMYILPLISGEPKLTYKNGIPKFFEII
ncbi:MAG: 6-phosphofructokinase [Oscillospiraceae bacterium]|nr:6-phosphofructokinase [Oscillospiraceae bacterium]